MTLKQILSDNDYNILSSLFLTALIVAFLAFATNEAKAEEEYCTSTISCRVAVQVIVQHQDAVARNGRQWGPVSRSACAIASREQEGNERRCRSYDLQAGGKTLAQCAKCYRQVREDIARWEQCHEEGYAPPPPAAIYKALARLGSNALALQ